MKNILLMIFTGLILFGCVTSQLSRKDQIRLQGRDVNEREVSNEEYMVDENGKEFYSEKVEPHYSKFRWIKNRKAPVYKDRSKFADPVTYIYSHEFVEVVDGKLGLELTRIRVFNKDRGYIEGYTKNKFLFSVDYYSEPYELTEMEILRRKEIAEKKRMREEERERKILEIQKEKEYNQALILARDDAKIVMKMNYNELTAYFKGIYTEDALYTQNAKNTLKFSGNGVSIYFTMTEGQISGIHAINNRDGFSIEESNVLLLELLGEIFYSVEDVENINKYILKKSGVFERSEYPMSVKFDNSKVNPIIELTIGDFSGIEK
ncbi:MAG: hypothetical protein PF574_08670 [Candidatus Delongbacteria bacterium]|jgi:hypothetical protein|nr:hypothetical protein [Candidatus Delongbacteria bacterium]